MESFLTASKLNKIQKLPFLHKASGQLGLLKFFLQLAWELKSLDTKKYVLLSQRLDEIGKMLGGWIKEIG
ncbi:MAG: four helix bundle protein, partial [Patescibacteria group bacterium]